MTDAMPVYFYKLTDKFKNLNSKEVEFLNLSVRL